MNEIKNMRDTLTAANFMAEAISRRLQEAGNAAPLIVAVSGIDASGKSTVSRRAVEALAARGLTAIVVSVDDWHNPPEKRFSSSNRGEHFYQNAFRFDELFRILIKPLRRLRELQVTIGLTRMPHHDSLRQTFDFRGVDVVILEGIFLLKREFLGHYDLTFWVECSYQTALARALRRNQDGLSGKEILESYRSIYFPAQRVHLAKDAPRERADFIIENDAVKTTASAPQAPSRSLAFPKTRQERVLPARLVALGMRAAEVMRFGNPNFAGRNSEFECT